MRRGRPGRGVAAGAVVKTGGDGGGISMAWPVWRIFSAVLFNEEIVFFSRNKLVNSIF
jgi:hypothetical protein